MRHAKNQENVGHIQGKKLSLETVLKKEQTMDLLDKVFKLVTINGLKKLTMSKLLTEM